MNQCAPIRLAFVLTELTRGGAEIMLWKLLSRIDRSRFNPSVFALSSRADGMLQRFNDIDINCSLFGMKPGPHAVPGLFRLGRALRHVTPDIVQGWLYHGNVAATLASALIGVRAPVLWSIRCTLPHQLSQQKWQSALTIWFGGKLSFSAAKIIHNSMASALQHEQRLGYRGGDHRIVVPNGFDTNVFQPAPGARLAVRDMLALPHNAMLIGLIGRYHVQKDHRNFLRAAALLRISHPDVHFVLAGEGVDRTNAALDTLISEGGLRERVHLLGARDDIQDITAALDIACCSSSYGEGFANVIGEAMSCGVPCVVTDVSDAAFIVGRTGKVVPPSNPQALAAALRDFVDMAAANRRALGLQARERVIEHFSLDAIVRQYEDLYLSVHEQSMHARKH